MANKKLGLKLGSKPEKYGALKLDNYITDGAVSVPSTVTIPQASNYPWGMLGNDRIGDCMPASLYHCSEVFRLWRGIETYPYQTAECVKLYSELTGYNPRQTQPDGSNPTDQGTDPSQAMSWWVKNGLPWHKLAGFGYLPASSTNLKRAIWEFSGVILAVALPTGAESQGVNWRGTALGEPGSWGGHAIVANGFTPNLIDFVSWGEEGDMDLAFKDKYLEQVFVPLSHEVLNSAGVGPAGFNFAKMLSDLPNRQL